MKSRIDLEYGEFIEYKDSLDNTSNLVSWSSVLPVRSILQRVIPEFIPEEDIRWASVVLLNGNDFSGSFNDMDGFIEQSRSKVSSIRINAKPRVFGWTEMIKTSHRETNMCQAVLASDLAISSLEQFIRSTATPKVGEQAALTLRRFGDLKSND